MRGVIIGWCAVLVFPLVAGEAWSQHELNYEVRARANLLFGTGETSGSAYYDVPITEVPTNGVLIKLPYTTKGGKLTFDLHHRVGDPGDLGYPAEIMTVVDVITGGANHLGTFTMLDVIDASSESSEPIERATQAEIDSYVSPMSRKTIVIDTEPGPQSVSIVGRELNITRSGLTTRIDTPGTRIAMVSNIRFEEAQLGETLEFEDLD